MRRLFCRFLLLVLAGAPAGARVVAYRLASPPLPVEAGQRFSLCAANVGTSRSDIQLQFVSVRTGAVVASREVKLPPPGTTAPMPDPCLATTAEAVMAAGNPRAGEQALVVGVVAVKRGIFYRAFATTAAVQVTAPDASGARRLVASVPLQMATLTDTRHTPIEIVH